MVGVDNMDRNFVGIPIVDADEPPENEDWILSPEKRTKEVAIFDMLLQSNQESQAGHGPGVGGRPAIDKRPVP